MTPLAFAKLFPEFRAPSWSGWQAVLKRLTPATREFYAICGRGAGKSRIVALLAAWAATREYKRAPGERIFCGVFAPDRKQSRITFRYVAGLLRSVPELAALIESEARESLELQNGVTVEVITASRAAPRGRAYALAIVEEAAFLPTGDSANPDADVLVALRPALARVPGSLLAVVSSPYARRGVLWEAWKKYHEQAPPDVLLVQAGTLELNPTFDQRAIEKAREEDPAAAAAEYDAQFRSDIESFVSRTVVDAAVVPGRAELPPVSGVTYSAFCDPSGGSGSDSFTLAVGHREKDGRVVVDALRERKPPFSPEGVVAEFSDLLKRYCVKKVVGDRYAGEWPREQFRKRGVEYAVSDRPKGDLYRDALPLLNSGQIELLDVPRLVAQIAGLERRTARGGRDSIDHAPGAHDDLANVVLGLAATSAAQKRKLRGGVIAVGRSKYDPGWVRGDDSPGDVASDAVAAAMRFTYRQAGHEADGKLVVFKNLRNGWGETYSKSRAELTLEEARQLHQRGSLRPADVEALLARGFDLEAS